jgi:hypothetical protein
MEIKNLFKKDITRNIEGVVTIGNEEESRKKQELEEYVCTNEVVDNFRKFFGAYRKSIQTPTDKMGVWITGFFGSGKSHFLKILGYVLSNEEVAGKRSLDYFQEKLKDSDQMIFADMAASAKANNLVILFNIDSKSKSDAKNRNLSIMETMLNCFNEKIGLCGSIPWLAHVENILIDAGKYEQFKARFAELTGKQWTDVRKDVFFKQKEFEQAISDAMGMSFEEAKNLYDQYSKTFKPSSEEFGKYVADYCEKNKCRVVFLMDEVGQFIGVNGEMMLGLQTVVEDLGKYANGKSWVVVTSQQQIDALVEGANKIAQQDFSKIQGRFNTRLTLSSSNADEVIKRRILEKTDDAKQLLGTMYNEDKLNNLLIFPKTPKWTGYKSIEQFVDDYPFVNYQYELLQKVFDAIRESGMSEGKHIASGERSLLSAFQKSAIAKCDQEVGLLIPFNDFYATAEEFLDWNIKQVFASAQRRVGDALQAFDIEVLKVLFMLKNVKEMEPTIERIATLMVTKLDDDKVALKEKIQASLKRLIDETLVSQNGDRYDFLTNEEQDVNRKIKNSDYSQADVLNKIRDIVYEKVTMIGKKYTYNRYTFGLNRYVDQNITGIENPDYVTVKIVTAWSGRDVNCGQESMSSDRVVIDMTNGSYLTELVNAFKIVTFDRNNSSGASSSLVRILNDKRTEEDEAVKRAEKNLSACLSSCDFYYNGSKLELTGSDPTKRMGEAIEKAIRGKFSKLDYVRDFANKNDDVTDTLRAQPYGDIVDIFEADGNSKALKEILSKVKEDKTYLKVSYMKGLIDYFAKNPYHWNAIDVRNMVARLLINNLLKAKIRGQVANIRSQDFMWAFAKGGDDDSITVEIQEKISEETLMNVRRIMKSAFEVTIEPKEQSLQQDSVQFFTNKYNALREISLKNGSDYPGKKDTEAMISTFGYIIQTNDPDSIFKRIVEKESDLTGYGEKLDSIISFFNDNGPQMKTWQDALEITDFYLKNSLLMPELSQMEKTISEMNSILAMEWPFDNIQNLAKLVIDAREVESAIETKTREKAEISINSSWDKIQKEAEEALKKEYQKPNTKVDIQNFYSDEKGFFEKLRGLLSDSEKVDSARVKASEEVGKFRDHLASLISIDQAESSEKPIKQIKKKAVRSSDLIPVANRQIKSKKDVDELVQNIKDSLEKYLDDNDEVDID